MKFLTPQQFADQMRGNLLGNGQFYAAQLGPGHTLSYNITDLTAHEKGLARAALAEWAAITGIRFTETTGKASITYVNDADGANTTSSISGSSITSSVINIASSRTPPGEGPGTFGFRTYLHETGHALGLGHPQDYGRVETFSQSAYANDSWQMSLMSYFSQTENTAIDASHAYHLTPMLADYLAVRATYGAVPVRAGNTTYGVGSTAGGTLDLLATTASPVTVLIADTGGTDTISFAGRAEGIRLDLRPGAISDVRGLRGNLQIAPDTTIENAVGGTGADRITGNAAGNILNGGGGADTLSGGAGNDIYVTDGGDVLIELAGGGTDTVRSSTNWRLGTDFEALELTGSAVSGTGNAAANRIVGNAGVNILDGGGGADTLIGGAGNDTYVVDAGDMVIEAAGGGTDLIRTATSLTLGANIENATLTGTFAGRLTGNALANTLTGNAAANVLDGGAGVDRMFGGAGDDTYYVAPGDVVAEVAGGGIDRMISAAGFTLGAEVEIGIVTGGAAASLAGNAMANLLYGSQGANRIHGGDGNDTIDGWGGADTLFGGAGNDVYIYRPGVTVMEAAGGGNDHVRAAVGVTLADNVEFLTLLGTGNLRGAGNALDNALTGNGGANILDGRGGDDALAGGAGADVFLFGAGRDRVMDFADDVDEVRLAGAALGLAPGSDPMAWAAQVGADVVFSFSPANVLTVRNTTLAAIQDDVLVV